MLVVVCLGADLHLKRSLILFSQGKAQAREQHPGQHMIGQCMGNYAQERHFLGGVTFSQKTAPGGQGMGSNIECPVT